jgi:hypothetical protein
VAYLVGAAVPHRSAQLCRSSARRDLRLGEAGTTSGDSHNSAQRGGGGAGWGREHRNHREDGGRGAAQSPSKAVFSFFSPSRSRALPEAMGKTLGPAATVDSTEGSRGRRIERTQTVVKGSRGPDRSIKIGGSK